MAELGATFIPFTAQTRMSGVDAGSSSVRKGAVDAILNYIGGGTTQAVASGNTVRAIQPSPSSEVAREIQSISDEIAKAGGTPLAVARTAACSASFSSRTSSRAVSGSVSPNCAAWVSAP